MDVVRTFPERVSGGPERYAMPRGKSPTEVKKRIGKGARSELAEARSPTCAATTRPGRLSSRMWSTRVVDLGDGVTM